MQHCGIRYFWNYQIYLFFLYYTKTTPYQISKHSKLNLINFSYILPNLIHKKKEMLFINNKILYTYTAILKYKTSKHPMRNLHVVTIRIPFEITEPIWMARALIGPNLRGAIADVITPYHLSICILYYYYNTHYISIGRTNNRMSN